MTLIYTKPTSRADLGTTLIKSILDANINIFLHPWFTFVIITHTVSDIVTYTTHFHIQIFDVRVGGLGDGLENDGGHVRCKWIVANL